MKDGYKKTELREIPIDWDVVKVNDLIDNEMIEEVLDGNHGSQHPKASEYVEAGIPFIMASNISNGKVDLKKCKYLTNERSKKLRKGFAITGDVLLTHKGTIGETAIVPDTPYEYLVLTPQVTYYRLKKDNNKLDRSYLKCFFDSKIYQSILKKAASQSTRDYVGITTQKKLSIILPPIIEQQKIADILSTVDEQIEQTDQLIEKTKELKKGLMQKLLTKGIGHIKFKKTEVGEIPEKWEVEFLGNIIKVSSGNGLKQKDMTLSGYPVYGGNGIAGYSNEYMFDEKQIVIGRVGAKCGCVHITEEKAWVTDNALYISERKKNFSDIFMFYLLNKLDLNKFANKNAQPVISGAKIYELRIPFPSIIEQKKIASILLSIDNQIEQHKSKKQKLEELKKGLMQQLLTGKIRVKVS